MTGWSRERIDAMARDAEATLDERARQNCMSYPAEIDIDYDRAIMTVTLADGTEERIQL